MYIYMRILNTLTLGTLSRRPFHRRQEGRRADRSLVFTRYSFTYEAFVHESSILSFPAPTCIAHPVQYYCTTIGQYTTLTLTSRLYVIHPTILVIRISC